ncbi:aldehyde dehydrogenase family protein [Diaphorobacter sp. HDW4A]|uniref:acylating sulfoacetaldehyde dehydrogenase n=1 Tax=Diaphorobacter sp. HDW4A TaxID=2714924 RepID=UPI001408AADE|nr:aldehyde dehydrogenase family protein [Diaphorobacter sp. HDW4A]QIL81346.1 aldehyde dehydrogenase family protein [Diaphorobacter sp. HDW4A]
MEVQETQRDPQLLAAQQTIAELMRRARAAHANFAQLGQQGMDDAVSAVGWAIMEPGRNRQMAELAVRETSLGNVNDKITKNHRKTLGLLRDLKGVRTHGVISENKAKGITEIARSVGVVAAITPSTNPGATPANNIINALKCGNAVIVAPSPKGLGVSQLLIDFIHAELRKCGLPVDLVQTLPSPISKALTAELMRQADLVIATGSQANVRMAYTCGTPAFGVGAGNVASIVDSSANLAEAAGLILASKTFDNATSCSSENSMVLLADIRDDMLQAMQARGGLLLNTEEKERLQNIMWRGGKLSEVVTGKSARVIAELAGIDWRGRIATDAPTALLVDETGIGSDHLFSGEKLSPVLTVYTAKDFNDAAAVVRRIYGYMGAGHSVSLHSQDDEQALYLAQNLPVARVILNQAHCFATGGNFNNGLPFSLSMGCGTWGGNNFSDNLNYRFYMNVTRVARTIAENKPSVDDMLGDWFRRYGA